MITKDLESYTKLVSTEVKAMSADRLSQTLDDSISKTPDISEGGLACRAFIRQNSKELPPLVGVPSSSSASRYAENNTANKTVHNNVSSFSTALNGCQPSPTQRRKLRYPTNVQLFWNNNKETNYTDVSKAVTTPSPPITPRSPSDCLSPGLLRRCRQRSSISLDGSPVVLRRSEQRHSLSSGRPGTPIGSPRITRSFSLGGNLNETSDPGAKLLPLELQSRTKSSDAINDQPLNQFSLHKSPEGRASTSDQSGDTPPVLKTVSHLHVLAEENTEDSSSFARVQQVLDDETGEVVRSEVDTSIDERDVPPRSLRIGVCSRDLRHQTDETDIRETNEIEEGSDEDLPDYQKKPLPTASRIAAWLEGLTDRQLEHNGTISKSTLPEIEHR